MTQETRLSPYLILSGRLTIEMRDGPVGSRARQIYGLRDNVSDRIYATEKFGEAWPG